MSRLGATSGSNAQATDPIRYFKATRAAQLAAADFAALNTAALRSKFANRFFVRVHSRLRTPV